MCESVKAKMRNNYKRMGDQMVERAVPIEEQIGLDNRTVKGFSLTVIT